MTSTYGYATVANIEARTGYDYSAQNAKLTDSVVESNITASEIFFNTKVGTTFTGTIPAGVTEFVISQTVIRLHNLLAERSNQALLQGQQAESYWDIYPPELQELVNAYKSSEILESYLDYVESKEDD
jgi:hypothetical protein